MRDISKNEYSLNLTNANLDTRQLIGKFSVIGTLTGYASAAELMISHASSVPVATGVLLGFSAASAVVGKLVKDRIRSQAISIQDEAIANYKYQQFVGAAGWDPSFVSGSSGKLEIQVNELKAHMGFLGFPRSKTKRTPSPQQVLSA